MNDTTPNEIIVTDHDVLKGRGVHISSHPGNKRFRALVQARYDGRYCSGFSTSEKKALGEEIVVHIQSLTPPGRFLKREGRCHSARGLDGPWEEMTGKESIKKACQALRDCNRPDREGYASKIPIPSDVLESTYNRVQSGISLKQHAAAVLRQQQQQSQSRKSARKKLKPAPIAPARPAVLASAAFAATDATMDLKPSATETKIDGSNDETPHVVQDTASLLNGGLTEDPHQELDLKPPPVAPVARAQPEQAISSSSSNVVGSTGTTTPVPWGPPAATNMAHVDHTPVGHHPFRQQHETYEARPVPVSGSHHSGSPNAPMAECPLSHRKPGPPTASGLMAAGLSAPFSPVTSVMWNQQEPEEENHHDHEEHHPAFGYPGTDQLEAEDSVALGWRLFPPIAPYPSAASHAAPDAALLGSVQHAPYDFPLLDGDDDQDHHHDHADDMNRLV